MKHMIEGEFRRKIKTADELIKEIGPRPRQKTVVMCHDRYELVSV